MADLTSYDITLLLRLVIAHLLADFLLQRKTWIQERSAKKWKAKTLYLHVLIVGVLTYVFSGYYQNFWIPLVVMGTHFLIDTIKSYTGNSLKYFLLDQLFHFIVILIAWYLYILPEINFSEIIQHTFYDEKNLVIITAYIFTIWPSGFLIAKITENWQNQIQNDGLEDAGRWIGMFERVLILTFVLINQFSGIGFLIAAKSILRFSDIKNAETRKDAEYILLGTMISFIIAIFTGIAVRPFL